MRPRVPPPLVTHGRARLNETWRLIDAPKGRTACQVRCVALARTCSSCRHMSAHQGIIKCSCHIGKPHQSVRAWLDSTVTCMQCSHSRAACFPQKSHMHKNSCKPLCKPDTMQGLSCMLHVIF